MAYLRISRPLVCLLVLSAGLIGVASYSNAGAQEDYHFAIDQAIVSAQQDKITILVSAADPTGQPLAGLTEFTALVDGTRVPVESVYSVTNRQAGIAVLLLIDISGSMEGEPLAQAKTAAATLVGDLLPNDFGALVSFAGSIHLAASFTSDRAALLTGIEALTTEPGGTALYDAVGQGLATANEAPASRRAIVLLTDGQDSGASRDTRDQAVSSASVTNIPIFAVGLGPDADTATLEAISGAAHGSFFSALKPSDLTTIFDAVGARLRSQYEIVLPLPNATLTSRDVTIETRVGDQVLHAQGQFVTVPPVLTVAKGSGARKWLWLLVLLFVLPVIALAARRLRRPRRGARSPVAGGPGDDLVLPARQQAAEVAGARSIGRLTVIEGPSTGQSVVVRSSPIVIGTEATCDLRLGGAEAGSGLPARAWLQHDRLIVHRIGPRAPGRTSTSDWESLGPNETITLGSSLFVFALEQAE